MTGLRVAVIDDRLDIADGRASWLRAAGFDVETLLFEEALERTAGWDRFDRALIDGRDDRPASHRFGSAELPDRFLGARVGAHIRDHTDPESRPVMIVVSTYARTHADLSLRCQESGIDFIFDRAEIGIREEFAAVVTDPGAHADRTSTSDREPRPREQALSLLETSSVMDQLVFDQPGDAAGAHELRILRKRLGELLGLKPPLPGPTGRARLPHKRDLAPLLRSLLGLGPDDNSH